MSYLLTYSTFVAQVSLIIIPLLSVLNDIYILGEDIRNELLMSPNWDKLYLTVGP